MSARLMQPTEVRGRLHAKWRLPLFFALAYFFSWSQWLTLALSGQRVSPGSRTTEMPGLAGPMLAALLVTALFDGRAGVTRLARSMFRWRVGWRGALIALGTPIAFGLVGVAAALVQGRPLRPEGFFLYPGIPAWGALPVFVVVLIVNGLGEETGWRGFAIPALEKRFSPLVATLVLLPFWALWHWPTFLTNENFRNFGLGTVVAFFLGLAGGAIVLTFVFHRSRDSVLMVASWHVLYNLFSATAAAQGVVAAVSSTLVMLWAVALVLLELRARQHGRSVLRPTPSPESRAP